MTRYCFNVFRSVFFAVLICMLAQVALAEGVIHDNFTLINAQVYLSAPKMGETSFRMSVTPNGSPTAARVLVQGCTQQATNCEFVGVWDSITAGTIPIFGNFDVFKFTGSETGGSNISVEWQGITDQPYAPEATFSPAQLNFNAVTLPASLTTANSQIVSLVGARAVTVFITCTQIFTLNVNLYDETGTTILATYAVRSAVPAAQHAFFAGSEIDPNGTAGSAGVSIRLPQKAMSISALNSTATPGTCSARIFTTY